MRYKSLRWTDKAIFPFRSSSLLERLIRWIGDSSAYLFVARKSGVICLTVKLLNTTSEENEAAPSRLSATRFYRGGNFFRDTPRLVHTLGAHASPDASAEASVRATGMRYAPLRARVSWYLGAHAGGEPRSRIAWNLVSRSAIGVRNARPRRCVYTYVTWNTLLHGNVILSCETYYGDRVATVRKRGG